MVRSTSSCFKIITCNRDSVKEEGFERIESKGSTDKRGWSFRKRSDRHRVPDNTNILEDSATEKGENSEVPSIDFHGATSRTIGEASRTEDVIPLSSEVKSEDVMIPLSSEVKSKAPDTLLLTEHVCKTDPVISKEYPIETGFLSIPKDATDSDPKLEESFVIVIQAAIRGHLSQKALLKIKNLVKLQAAIRGHLVRSQAVGTLRCVQAIVKMQALVRARHARISMEGSLVDVKLADEIGMDGHSIKSLGKEIKGNSSLYSTEKLLGNALARQLLHGTSKKKSIHIKCDPLKSDSAWKWLERWMSVSSSDCAQPQKPHVSQKNDKQETQVDTTACGLGTKAPAEVVSKAVKENLVSVTDNTDFHSQKPTASLKTDECQPPRFDGGCLNGMEEPSSRVCTNERENDAFETVLDSIRSEPEAANDQLMQSMKRIASEQPETEGKKFVTGPRKAFNPAFVAAQSKFKELSSTTTSSMASSSIIKDTGTELISDSRLSPPAVSQRKIPETIMPDLSNSDAPRTLVGDLDLDAKFSGSSSFDSPDRSDIRGKEKKEESKIMEEMTSDLNSSNDNSTSPENLDIGHPVVVQPGKLDIGSKDSTVSENSQQPERSASDVQIQQNLATEEPAYRLSPDGGSPRSHVTISESHGTPSSQVSMKAKRKELNRSDQAQSRKPRSADKRSSSNPSHDSGSRNSVEKVPKDSKSGKRRNSFGAAKSDHADQEPRENNSSSLPSYMQATESARAKAQASNSPRSSPDVQDSDLYIKKRHSLPSANGKQGSPRMPSSSPQAQQLAKGDTQSSRERWQR